MKIKWNFGTGIVVFLILFMSFMLTMVYKCGQVKSELVSDKYYDQEINYQKQIDKTNNASKLKENIKVIYNKPSKAFVISYPQDINPTDILGEITFYKPDNQNADFNINVTPDKENKQLISAEKISKGLWNVHINWAASNVSYYFESQLFID